MSHKSSFAMRGFHVGWLAMNPRILTFLVIW